MENTEKNMEVFDRLRNEITTLKKEISSLKLEVQSVELAGQREVMDILKDIITI